MDNDLAKHLGDIRQDLGEIKGTQAQTNIRIDNLIRGVFNGPASVVGRVGLLERFQNKALGGLKICTIILGISGAIMLAIRMFM